MGSATARFRDQPERAQERPVAVSAREGRLAEPVTGWETLAIVAIFGLLYTIVGFNIVADLHVVNFDALDRLSGALMVWHNDPAKLAAIGFSVPPLSTLALVPFAAARDAVTSGLALPLSSAIFAAAGLVFLNRMFAIAEIARAPRLLVVLLVALNPMFAYYAMNGTGDADYMAFGAFGLFCLVGWGRNGSARYLIGAGLAFALAGLTRYEFILWALLIAFLIAATLSARGRGKEEVEGSTLAYLAPAGYALGIWIFFNALILGDPLGWVSAGEEIAPVNAVVSPIAGFDLAGAAGHVLRIELIFPASLVVVPLLLLNFGGGRDTISIGLALLVLLNIGYALAAAAIDDSTDAIELSDALPGMLAGVAGFAWLYLRSPRLRPTVLGLLIALSAIALPSAWMQMKTYPHQNLEQAFTRALATGDDQEGTASRGGYEVGVAPEQAMARYIEDLELPGNRILTDDARTYGVIALTGEPELFFDRVSRGDDEWEATLADPAGEVELMLAERSEADRILREYPGAVEGEVPSLELVVANDRYALLRVLDAAQPGEPAGAGV
jgi:hypothetical protein